MNRGLAVFMDVSFVETFPTTVEARMM